MISNPDGVRGLRRCNCDSSTAFYLQRRTSQILLEQIE